MLGQKPKSIIVSIVQSWVALSEWWLGPGCLYPGEGWKTLSSLRGLQVGFPVTPAGHLPINSKKDFTHNLKYDIATLKVTMTHTHFLTVQPIIGYS